ncbi:MAG: VHL beta domain-containing protein [Methyloceanibacter sp.]
MLLASASCWSSLATRVAAADDRLEWQFFESNDPANKGRMTAGLIYGVPETDNVQVSGVCEAGSSSGVKSSSVVFGADIGDLQNGKDIELRFSGGGFDHALKGQIHRPASEEGLSGIHVDIAHDDPLWRAMAEKDSLDYLVPGYKAATLDLTRGKDRIEAFVQACRTYATANAGQQVEGEAAAGGGNGAEKDAFDSAKELSTLEAWEAFLASYPSGFHADLTRAYVKKLGPNPPPPQAAKMSTAAEPGPDPSCKQRSKLRSQNSNTPTSITFINKSGQYRGILGLDFDGQPKDYANLNSGERVTLSTFMTHPWMITDGPGNCIQIVMPRGGGRVVELGGGGAA